MGFHFDINNLSKSKALINIRSNKIDINQSAESTGVAFVTEVN